MSTYWLEPEATVRGSVVVVAGRGESTEVYGRFARRIAFDGYRVTVVGTDDAALTAVDDATAALPVVVVGSDSGSSTALALAASRPVTGVVLAGILTGAARTPGLAWDDELEVRSGCPVHRGVLESAVERGAFSTQATVVESLSGTAVPTLVLHGSADAISPVDDVWTLASDLPDGRFVLVDGGRHDILNDVSHRSVAAEIVQFLERLRSPGAPDIVVRTPVGALAG